MCKFKRGDTFIKKDRWTSDHYSVYYVTYADEVKQTLYRNTNKQQYGIEAKISSTNV